MLRRFIVLLGLGVLFTAASARAQPIVHSTPFEAGGALTHFYGALQRLERDPTRRVRVMHFGDSHVAADLWTNVARRTLQDRFGHGGNGYLLPHPFGSVHRGDVRLRAEGHWEACRLGFAREFGPADGYWGLAGVAIEPAGPASRIVVDVPAATEPRVMELHLLGRNLPSVVTVQIDDAPAEEFDTLLDEPGLILRRWMLDEHPHHVVIRPTVGRPRVLGVVVERRAGVIYDVFGINGHRGNAVLRWDQDLLRAQLQHRAPDLVVFSYGGNEALDPTFQVAAYRAQLHASLSRFRALAPGASCLVVGPVGTVPERGQVMQSVTDAQREIAPSHGCAFFDSSHVSGGHGRLLAWARHPQMVAGDHLHLGRLGYRAVGEQYIRAILGGI